MGDFISTCALTKERSWPAAKRAVKRDAERYILSQNKLKRKEVYAKGV